MVPANWAFIVGIGSMTNEPVLHGSDTVTSKDALVEVESTDAPSVKPYGVAL